MTTTGIQHRLVLARAPAKLNLFLEVKDKRPDGFHEIETVMVAVSLVDSLTLERRPVPPRVLRVTSSPPLGAIRSQVPTGRENLVYKAWDRWSARNEAPTSECWVPVALHKRIPDQAGLGGGSSDAAAVFRALRGLEEPQLDDAVLSEMAADVGSDVPFFVRAGVSVCRGRGERLEALPFAGPLWFVIAKPPVGISTRDVYARVALPQMPRSCDDLVEALRRRTPRAIGRLMFNRLQAATESLVPEIQLAAHEFARLDSCGHQMTGSGSAYFGLFPDRATAGRAERILRSRLPDWFVSRCCSLAPCDSEGLWTTLSQEARRADH